MGRKWKSFILPVEKALFRVKIAKNKIRLPILSSATLKINVKFQIREKVVQKCPNFLVCFMTIHEYLVPFSSRTLRFSRWSWVCRVCGVKNCCDSKFFRFLSNGIREKVVQKCPQLFSVFYDRTWVFGPIFKSYASFFGEEGVGGFKNCCNNTFRTISEHKNTYYCNGKMATLKNG